MSAKLYAEPAATLNYLRLVKFHILYVRRNGAVACGRRLFKGGTYPVVFLLGYYKLLQGSYQMGVIPYFVAAFFTYYGIEHPVVRGQADRHLSAGEVEAGKRGG